MLLTYVRQFLPHLVFFFFLDTLKEPCLNRVFCSHLLSAVVMGDGMGREKFRIRQLRAVEGSTLLSPNRRDGRRW